MRIVKARSIDNPIITGIIKEINQNMNDNYYIASLVLVLLRARSRVMLLKDISKYLV